jgi:hypothetical protein
MHSVADAHTSCAAAPTGIQRRPPQQEPAPAHAQRANPGKFCWSDVRLGAEVRAPTDPAATSTARSRLPRSHGRAKHISTRNRCIRFASTRGVCIHPAAESGDRSWCSHLRRSTADWRSPCSPPTPAPIVRPSTSPLPQDDRLPMRPVRDGIHADVQVELLTQHDCVLVRAAQSAGYFQGECAWSTTPWFAAGVRDQS